MKKICVFCGSSSGKSEKYVKTGFEFGKWMATENFGLVYGGASIGVMGAIADGALEASGKVYGVIPKSLLEWEVGHQGLEELEVVDTMHARKERMYELSDYFVAFPGGMGTLDELCEIVTWCQLKYHNKPIYVYNQDGFFDALMNHFRHINKEGFLSDEHLAIVREIKDLEQLKAAILE